MNKSEPFYKEKIKRRDIELKFFGYKSKQLFISEYAAKPRVRVGKVKAENPTVLYSLSELNARNGSSLANLVAQGASSLANLQAMGLASSHMAMQQANLAANAQQDLSRQIGFGGHGNLLSGLVGQGMPTGYGPIGSYRPSSFGVAATSLTRSLGVSFL